ncbi:MAG: glyoxalase, partial [Planctomycetes bacterium]|nr:glyoxalase [Planctomycetota bacterium]
MKPKVLHTHHVLAVNDLASAASYFREKLGFEFRFAVEGWQFLSLGDFRVMLGECKDEVPARETNNHSYFAHVMLADVRPVYAEMCARG